KLLAFLCAVDVLNQTFIQPAREPTISSLLFDTIGDLVRALIAKLLRVRLAAGNAAIKENAVFAVDVRLGRNRDLFLRVNFKISWRAGERSDDECVFRFRLGREVFPKKAMHWVQMSRIFLAFNLRQIFFVDRDDGVKKLLAVEPDPFFRFCFDSFERKPEQPVGFRFHIQRKDDTVRAGNRVELQVGGGLLASHGLFSSVQEYPPARASLTRLIISLMRPGYARSAIISSTSGVIINEFGLASARARSARSASANL